METASGLQSQKIIKAVYRRFGSSDEWCGNLEVQDCVKGLPIRREWDFFLREAGTARIGRMHYVAGAIVKYKTGFWLISPGCECRDYVPLSERVFDLLLARIFPDREDAEGLSAAAHRAICASDHFRNSAVLALEDGRFAIPRYSSHTERIFRALDPEDKGQYEAQRQGKGSLLYPNLSRFILSDMPYATLYSRDLVDVLYGALCGIMRMAS